MELSKLFGGAYAGKTVFLTGHTGFKGAWLTLWLQAMGARVVGYALEPPSEPSLWDLLQLDIDTNHRGDIRSPAILQEAMSNAQPDIVFHLAAQPLVRPSYEDPHTTFETNVMGTLNVLQAAGACPSVRAVVNVTSDKCYENQEWPYGYRELDPMGGHDPYSASKGCAELLASAWRRSYYQPKGQILLGSVRAGNVIGGGDWGAQRLIPDVARAVQAGSTVEIRSPRATRPWQHVLEPLSGYLLLGQHLLAGQAQHADGWNFGPDDEATLTVEQVMHALQQTWPAVNYSVAQQPPTLHEAQLLKLDASKARQHLGWRPVWPIGQTLVHTAAWYRDFFDRNYTSIYERTLQDLHQYVHDAQALHLAWAKP